MISNVLFNQLQPGKKKLIPVFAHSGVNISNIEWFPPHSIHGKPDPIICQRVKTTNECFNFTGWIKYKMEFSYKGVVHNVISGSGEEHNEPRSCGIDIEKTCLAGQHHTNTHSHTAHTNARRE